MKHLFTTLSAFTLWMSSVAQAATLTISNYNSEANGFYGIADVAGTRIAPTVGGGVIGRFATLSDEAISAHVSAGNIAALELDFRVFGSAFALDLTNSGPDGAFQKVVTASTLPSADTNSFGGNAIYVWLYKGASRAAATEYFLVRLSQSFPVDPESLPPLFVEVAVRPDTVATYYAGALGAETFDYGEGSGSLAMFRMQSTTGVGNMAPVAQSQTIQVVTGVPYQGNVTATDGNLDALTYSKLSDPTKGDLVFNQDGSFTYTATAGQSGQDSFTFQASDGMADSNIGTVTVQIQDSALSQTLSFAAPSQKQVGDAPFPLVASASSGLTVSFQILSGPATVSGNTVTLTGAAGVVHIRASQAGNEAYLAAAPVDRHFHVVPVSAAFNLVNLVQTYTGQPLSVGVTGVSPESVTITYNGSNDQPINAGTYNVVAVSGAARKTGRLVIHKAPLVVTADDQRKFIGQPNPVLTFSYSGFLGGDNEASVFPAPPAPPAKPTASVPVISTTAKETSTAGRYPITFKGGLAVNYRFVFMAGSLLVESFEGRYENLLISPDTQRPIAKVELTVAKVLKNGKMAYTGRIFTPTDLAAIPIRGELTVDSATETASGTWTLTKVVNRINVQYALSMDLDILGGFEAALDVDGSLFAEAEDGARIFIPAKGQAVTNAGALSMILAPGIPAVATTTPLPLGSGHAIGTVDAKAVMKLTMTLADGTKTTASLSQGVDGGYRLFLAPYRRLQSYVSAWLDLESYAALAGRSYIPTARESKLTWTKAAGDKDKSYRSGIELLDSVITLDPWRRPMKATRTAPEIALLQELGITDSTVISVAHSGFPGVDAGLLPTEIKIAANGKVTVETPAGNTASWQITITPNTGLFTGRFTLRNEKVRTVNFTGVLRRRLDTNPSDVIGRGNFQLPALPSASSNEIQSGDIRLFVP